jgi:hypothetical protein
MVTEPTPVTPGQEAAPPRRRRRAHLLRALLALAFAAACFFAGWQIYVFFTQRTSACPARSVPPDSLDPMALPDRLPGPTSSPRALMDNPWGTAGLQVIDADPGDIPPPAGAARRLAREYRMGRLVWQEAGYDFRGRAESAEEHYRKALARVGFRVVSTWGAPAVWRTIGFARGAVAGTVSLRKVGADATMTKVVLRVSRPAE